MPLLKGLPLVTELPRAGFSKTQGYERLGDLEGLVYVAAFGFLLYLCAYFVTFSLTLPP